MAHADFFDTDKENLLKTLAYLTEEIENSSGLRDWSLTLDKDYNIYRTEYGDDVKRVTGWIDATIKIRYKKEEGKAMDAKPTHFCHKANGEFVLCYSEEEAKTVADLSLNEARYDSQNMEDENFWPKHIDELCWGEIKGRAVESKTRDYKLEESNSLS